MSQKELIPSIYLKDGKAVCGLTDDALYSDAEAAELAADYGNRGADAILLFDLSNGDVEHDTAIGLIREAARSVDIPIYGGGNVRRLEDVKKLLYAGCRKVFLNYAKEENIALTKEASERFGREKLLACVRTEKELAEAVKNGELLSGIVDLSGCVYTAYEAIYEQTPGLPAILPVLSQATAAQAAQVLSHTSAAGLCCDAFRQPDFDYMGLKHFLKSEGIAVNTYESAIRWEDFIENGDGLVPVVVQDYKTQEVLMVAYMNKEAFELTMKTGRMTYWSRSRRELWVKGLTSGHFQYVKELRIDCDNDTLLAKVHQVGAACHTGSRSCFYRTLMKKEYAQTNPLQMLESVYGTIEDRKLHPKEGSYTNYLFDKGIDKILKKVGEEAAEIIIAAKNPDPEEIKYEISDFLYHVMVLMSLRGVTWEDIMKELARR